MPPVVVQTRHLVAPHHPQRIVFMAALFRVSHSHQPRLHNVLLGVTTWWFDIICDDRYATLAPAPLRAGEAPKQMQFPRFFGSCLCWWGFSVACAQSLIHSECKKGPVFSRTLFYALNVQINDLQLTRYRIRQIPRPRRHQSIWLNADSRDAFSAAQRPWRLERTTPGFQSRLTGIWLNARRR